MLHLAIQPVLSGSMRPTFSPGAVVITRSIPTSSIRPGDIILFVPPGDTSQYAHRVTSVSGPAGRPVITTKGDANPAPDGWHAQIVGRRSPSRRLHSGTRADHRRGRTKPPPPVPAGGGGTHLLRGRSPEHPRVAPCAATDRLACRQTGNRAGTFTNYSE